MGFLLAATLILVSSQMEPHPPTIPTSQIDQLRKPFTPEQEPSRYQITGTNFAAPREAAKDALARADDEEPKPERKTHTPPRTQPVANKPAPVARPADNPISMMMAIH